VTATISLRQNKGTSHELPLLAFARLQAWYIQIKYSIPQADEGRAEEDFLQFHSQCRAQCQVLIKLYTISCLFRSLIVYPFGAYRRKVSCA
jgi:hypothetical protein